MSVSRKKKNVWISAEDRAKKKQELKSFACLMLDLLLREMLVSGRHSEYK